MQAYYRESEAIKSPEAVIKSSFSSDNEFSLHNWNRVSRLLEEHTFNLPKGGALYLVGGKASLYLAMRGKTGIVVDSNSIGLGVAVCTGISFNVMGKAARSVFGRLRPGGLGERKELKQKDLTCVMVYNTNLMHQTMPDYTYHRYINSQITFDELARECSDGLKAADPKMYGKAVDQVLSKQG
ncbi:MAG: hypothetical protein JWO38_1112 [Gemmataceae bacterium]|nr:hypothetical protein [Gemmataceae bacterium]